MLVLPEQVHLLNIPKLGGTKGIPFLERIIYLHYSYHADEWYIAEFDGDDVFYGFSTTDIATMRTAEWAIFQRSCQGIKIDIERDDKTRKMISHSEEQIGIYCDSGWQPTRSGDIEKIRISQYWPRSACPLSIIG